VIEDFIQAAEQAADLAAAAIRGLFRARLAVEGKKDASPVTIADRSAELAMREMLSRTFPDHSIFGEEFGEINPGRRFRWVLDPIDGTRAFITGRPQFGTLVALFDGQTPILGVIDQPITRERWVGARGRATRFCGEYGAPGARACASLDEAELSVTSPDIFGPDLPRWQRLRDAAKRVSYGGDCYAYGLLALGQIDIVAEATMQPWDWAALVPIVEGAGGSITDWQGCALTPDGDGRVLAVGDIALREAAIALLAE
jgi:histidinol phosphatase-like enzyme (inositol monophosphatase family)